jgi:hypothetical protein
MRVSPVDEFAHDAIRADARRENVMNLGIGLLIIVGAWTLLSVLVSVTVGGMAEGRDARRPSAERALRQRREADSAERLVS